jgi:hypothetical protein
LKLKVPLGHLERTRRNGAWMQSDPDENRGGERLLKAERRAPQAHQLWQRKVLIRIGNGLLDGHFGESAAMRRVAQASPPRLNCVLPTKCPAA